MPTSMQKSPRMVPGGASTGSVAPMRARETRTTSSPCHTCGRSRWRGVSAGAGLALHPPSSTHHGHHRSRAHVLDQAAVKGALTQFRVVLAQQLFRGLGRERIRLRALGPRPSHAHSRPAATPAPALTCSSFSATSLKPFLSKRRTISPTSRRCTPSGFTARKVRSCTLGKATGPAGPHA